MTPEGHFRWERAGLYPADGDSLGGAASLDLGEVLAPQEVWTGGDSLYWRFTARTPTSSKGMLDALLRIHTPRDVVRFVGRFGPLLFCEHRLPVGHNPFPHNAAIDDPDWWRLGAGWLLDPDREWVASDGGPDPASFCHVKNVPGTSVRKEPVSAYVRLADSLRAGLDIASALRLASPRSFTWDSLGTDEQWLSFTLDRRPRPWSVSIEGRTPDRTPEGPVSTQDLYVARRAFTLELRQLTALGRLRPGVTWLKDGPPQFGIETDPFGALLLQLFHAVSGTHTLAVCSGCGQPYPRSGRKPQAGRRNYCAACRDAGVPWRDAKQVQRAGARKATPASGDRGHHESNSQ